MEHRANFLTWAEYLKWFTHRTGSWCWLLAGSSGENATRAPIQGSWVLKEVFQDSGRRNCQAYEGLPTELTQHQFYYSLLSRAATGLTQSD